MFAENDRVSMGTSNGVVFGRVLRVARDGEVKVLFDGNSDAMWYPSQAIQLVELDNEEVLGYSMLTLVKED